MGVTTRANIPQEVSNFYDRTLLYRAVALFVHTQWAQTRPIPRKAGTATIKFRRYGNLPAALTPLGEGITPPGSSLSVTDILATVLQYGDYITISDVLDYESQDPVLMEAAEILGDQAGDTLDQLTRDVLAAGTNVYYGGNATSTITVDSADLIDATVIKKVVRLLKIGKARKITRMIEPTTGIATQPLNASYVGIVHPSTTYDLKNVTGWIPVEKYSAQKKVMMGEVGAVDEVRFVETTNAKILTGAGASGIDVYVTLILGDQAYATSQISGEAMKNIVKPLGSAGTGDPLEQRATSGWKATFVAKILNNAFLVRIEHAVSA